jgi:hypothetical protein
VQKKFGFFHFMLAFIQRCVIAIFFRAITITITIPFFLFETITITITITLNVTPFNTGTAGHSSFFTFLDIYSLKLSKMYSLDCSSVKNEPTEAINQIAKFGLNLE